jgi:predicted secreted Zn-dependent protease
LARKLRYALGAVCLISATTAPFAAAAEPTISEELSHYDVVGASPAELVAEMNALGPIDSNDGKKVWAKTRWHVNWQHAYHTEASTCSLDKVSVNLRIDYTYPRWKNESDADEATRNVWNPFILALQKHERQHGQHGIDAAHEIEKEIESLEGRRTCDALREAADALGHSIVKKHAGRDIEYDQRTHHGRDEGIHLP